MSRSLNRLAFGLLVLMVALLVQLTRIQVFQADELNAMPGNQRTLLTEYSRERGPILVDQAPIARSVPTDDDLKYLRRYDAGKQYASATGFYSIVFGATGLDSPKPSNDACASGVRACRADRTACARRSDSAWL